MATIAFDTLAYARKLEQAGVKRAEAEAQAQGIRELVEAQAAAMDAAFKKYDTERRKYEADHRNKLATKADLRETELCLQNDLRETELRLQNNLRETELRLQKDMEKIKSDMLKWGIAGWISLAAIMAKGFNWIGF